MYGSVFFLPRAILKGPKKSFVFVVAVRAKTKKKNHFIQSKIIPILKLARFFFHCVGGEQANSSAGVVLMLSWL